MKQFFESTKPGGQLLALLLLFVIFFIIAAGCSAFAMLFGLGVDSPELNDISQVIMFAATAIVFAALFYGRPLRHLQMVKTDRMAVKMSAAFCRLAYSGERRLAFSVTTGRAGGPIAGS